MKNIQLFLAITLFMFIACSKNDLTVPPTSSFNLQGDTLNTLKIGTYDSIALINSSENADSIFWDFGDGRTSTKNELYLSYPVSGNYTVTLTARNSEGQESTSSKEVVVLDRVLKSINIQIVQWSPINTNGWPTSSVADVYFQIQDYTDTTVKQYSIYPNCPVIYTSPVVSNIGNSTRTAFSIPVSEKVVIDKRKIQFAYPESLNNTYLMSLMAKDKDGNIYCLQNNHGGGGNYFGILKDDINSNEFIIQNGPFSSYLLVCEFVQN